MNKALKRPRCDAKVKNLPEERQAEIFKHRATHTTEQTALWLARQGIQTSVTALWGWHSWYVTKRNFEELETNIVHQLILFKRRHPKITQEDLDELGEFLFNAMAINRKDIKTWNLAQQIRLKRVDQLLRKKCADNAARKRQGRETAAAAGAGEAGLTPVERKAAVRQILGIS